MPYDLESLSRHVVEKSAEKPGWLAFPTPVVLYGAGNFGRDVLKVLRAKNLTVTAFLDGKIKAPGDCEGTPVYPLDSPEARALASQNLPVLITIHSHHFDLAEVPPALSDRGFSQIVSPMEIYNSFSRELGDRYWLAPSSYYLNRWDSFISGLELWSDDLSRDTYCRLLWYRLGFDLSAHPIPQMGNQYAPTDLPRWPEPVRLLDGGACEGDALKILLQSGYAVDQVYAWEPDVINYRKLATYLRESRPDLRTTLFPCGLGSSIEVVNFDGGRGTSSAISETGRDRLVVLAADTAMANQPVSLIKLDIEGAEAAALHGMRNLIAENHPAMAVCVYHRPGDMVDIPRQIQSWGRPYRFYLRSHAWNTFETVLYALPQ
jgi:FkbM family methyltransferase